ncbi:MAG: gliding motility protein GldL, partial [Bacteroidota bacterium]
MSKKGGFGELLFSTIMPKVYGIGAAIVIVGALFKIIHAPGANEMLMVGLITEAIIFFLSAFEPKQKELDWSKVYPELSDDYAGPPASAKKAVSSGGASATKMMDKALESAKMGPELFDSLGKGMKNLADTAKKMQNLGDASVATSEYATNVKSASKSLSDMNKSYSTTLTAMSDMANASKDAQAYQSQVQNVTKNLGALNKVYELELNDASSHLKAMNKFYSNVTGAMEAVSNASKEAQQFEGEMKKLTTNISSLN